MADSARMSTNSFLYSQSRYYGQVTPENLAFNANLQEFAQSVSYISALETGGKLSPEEAFEKIKHLWQELKQSRKALGVNSQNLPQVMS